MTWIIPLLVVILAVLSGYLWVKYSASKITKNGASYEEVSEG